MRFKQQCPDLVHALWAKMNVRYDMLAFDGSPASVELNNLGTGDVRAALEVRRRKVDRLARVDFVKYGFSSVAEMQMFAAFLPTFPHGISVDMLRLFNTSSWMAVVALAQECYRTTGIKLVSVPALGRIREEYFRTARLVGASANISKPRSAAAPEARSSKRQYSQFSQDSGAGLRVQVSKALLLPPPCAVDSPCENNSLDCNSCHW